MALQAPGTYKYYNDAGERYSPRFGTHTLTAYLIEDGIRAVTGYSIQNIMKRVINTNWDDYINTTFWGGDGKKAILGLRYYPGLGDSIKPWHKATHQGDDLWPIVVGNKYLKDAGGNNLKAKIFQRDYIQWNTSELIVPHIYEQTPLPPRGDGGYTERYFDYMATYQLWLPYYGFLELDPSDCVDHSIVVWYNIDIYTGMCTIDVVCKRLRPDHSGGMNGDDEVAYSVTTKFGEDIPLTPDMNQSVSLDTFIGMGKAVVGVATRGVSTAILNQNSSIKSAARTISNNNPADYFRGSEVSKYGDDTEFLSQVIEQTAETINSSPNLVPTPSSPEPVRSTGGMNATGSCSILFPYLRITYPVSAAPDDYQDYYGQPTSSSGKLSDFNGFTQISSVKPSSSYTDKPKYYDEIVDLLQKGVYL